MTTTVAWAEYPLECLAMRRTRSFETRQAAEEWALVAFGRTLPGVTFHEREPVRARVKCYVRTYDNSVGNDEASNREYVESHTVLGNDELTGMDRLVTQARELRQRAQEAETRRHEDANCHRCWPTPSLAKRLLEALQSEHRLLARREGRPHSAALCEVCDIIAEAKG